MNYGTIDKKEASLIPPRKINGGLYTGTPALPHAPWANIPVVPEAHIYITQNLKSADPPPRAMDTIPGGGTRVGNSLQTFPNHKLHSNRHHLQYVSDERIGNDFLKH